MKLTDQELSDKVDAMHPNDRNNYFPIWENMQPVDIKKISTILCLRMCIKKATQIVDHVRDNVSLLEGDTQDPDFGNLWLEPETQDLYLVDKDEGTLQPGEKMMSLVLKSGETLDGMVTLGIACCDALKAELEKMNNTELQIDGDYARIITDVIDKGQV